jgi:hypothetical protein
MRRLEFLLRRSSLGPALVGLVAACAGADDDPAQVSFGPAGQTASDTASSDSTGGDDNDDADSMTSNPSDPSDPSADDSSGDPTSATADDTTDGGCVEGDVRPCYTGPVGTADVGMCMGGTETCVDGEWAGFCYGEVLPGVESCDSEDEDCDGIPDDGLNAGMCNTGLQGPCAMGTNACMVGQMMCVPNVMPMAETCGDNIDQNCNGVPDDGCNMSCPYVYGHDGDTWVYAGAVGGASVFGRPEQLARGRGKRPAFAPLWVHLDRGALVAAEDGTLATKAKLLVAEDEIAYVDRLALAVVEHPANTEVVASSALQWTRGARPDVIALPSDGMRVPVRATWKGRVDVTAEIGLKDERAVAFDRAAENFYEMDFGAVRAGESVHLVIDGWKLKELRDLPASVRRRRPFVQVQRGDGAWHTVMAVPSPRGDRKTIAIDLSNVGWDAASYRVRLWTGTHEGGRAMWYVDRARLCVGAPTEPTVRIVEADRACLHFEGVPTAIDPADHGHPRWNVPDGGGELGDEHRTFGAFTRYGDVSPLVANADDRVVVMRRGDGIDLSFRGIAPAAPGAVLSLFLTTELVYKPRVMPGAMQPSAISQRVLPLPHRGMAHYADDAPQRDDAAYLAYRRTWNTRVYEAGSRCWGEPPAAITRPLRTRATATQLASLPLAA